MKLAFSCIAVLILTLRLDAQSGSGVELDGQLSLIGSFSPDNRADGFLGARYIPELSYERQLDTFRSLSVRASAYMSASVFTESLRTFSTDGNVDPYRIYGSYRNGGMEIRAGLQKIDFGSATLLRPIQWFNQIDPRDPLQLTNGVYGVLGRYYFPSNANIWLWALYGNELTRGFDAVGTNPDIPEFGGRLQLPIKAGEVALSLHRRTASTENRTQLPNFEKIPEYRLGLDGKWDVGVGLWFEAAHVRKERDLGSLTNQSLFNVGLDYTLGIGNGLGVVLEHLLVAYDERALSLTDPVHATATSVSYPLGLFGSLSSVLVYGWDKRAVTFQLNYEHQFPRFAGYVMFFYNPATPVGIRDNELVQQFQGPGIRLMLVKNH